ncbi:MAG: hypothetical protein ACRD3L_08010 [Terriglobales bacterium]
MTVTPVLRISSGQEVPLDPVTIDPNDSVSVWVNEGLLKHSAGLLSQPGSFGSIVLRFTSFNARNLHAAVVLSLHGEPIAFQLTGHPSAKSERWPHATFAGSQEGIWWRPRPFANDFLVVSNSSDKNVTGMLRLSDAAGKRWSQRLNLGARETQRLNVAELLQSAGLTGQYGGLQIEVGSSAGSLDSVHFMYDETARSSMLLRMVSRDPMATQHERVGPSGRQWALWAPMLALRVPDPALSLPAKTLLQPTIFLRNTTGNVVPAKIGLSWSSNGGRGQAELPQLDLAPFATRQLRIGDMQKQLGIPDDTHWALVKLTGPKAPGDIVAIAISSDATGRYATETVFTDNAGRSFAAGEWQVDANHNHLVAVTNVGVRPADALLTLHYDNGTKSYEMKRTIQPGDQMRLNLAELIHDRVADRKGNVLPPDLSSGTYDLEDLSHGAGNLLAGALALDHTWGFNGRPPAQTCCADYVPGFNPSYINVILGGYVFTNILSRSSCSENYEDVSEDFDTWWSTNPPTAGVTYENVHGVSPGSTFANASGQIWEGIGTNCSWQPEHASAPAAVGPYQVEPLSTASQGPAQCTPGLAGWVRNVTNQLQYQNGAAYAVDNVSVSDTLRVGSKHDLGSGTSTGTTTTTGDGSFPDTYSVCSTACPGSGETDALQSWTANGLGLSHVNLIVYKCSSISVDAH